MPTFDVKTCNKCSQSKPLEEFSKHSGRRDGLQSMCKACFSLNNAAIYAENREKVKARVAAYQSANADKVKSYMAEWYAKNGEKIMAYRASRSPAYREKARLRATAWSAANPERRRIHEHNRRAKELSGGKLSHDIAAKLIKLQRGKCACCGEPLGDDYHRDHIMPLALGGTNTDDNIQLLRATCNLQKNAKHPVEFMQQRGFLL